MNDDTPFWMLQDDKDSHITFLFIAQNLQSDSDGGNIWFTISLRTGTFSFFKDAHNLEDSLTAIALLRKSEKNTIKSYILKK